MSVHGWQFSQFPATTDARGQRLVGVNVEVRGAKHFAITARASLTRVGVLREPSRLESGTAVAQDFEIVLHKLLAYRRPRSAEHALPSGL